MSKFVMSDLHGEYEKFIKMLKLINFKDEDELYILGDIFDRGSRPIDILDYIVGKKNIVLLKGNHEMFFQEYFVSGDGTLWYYNGGESTLSQIHQRGYEYEYQLYSYIRKLPIIKVVEKFILVHAGLYLPKNYNELELEDLLKLQEEDINLWSRENIYSDKKYRDYTIICGHSTVQSIKEDYESIPSIIHRPGHIFIDCGCCFPDEKGRLACLRLDDMQEFYI